MFKKREKKKKTELQREMDKYMNKMKKLNSQLDNLNTEVMKKTKFNMDNKRYIM